MNTSETRASVVRSARTIIVALLAATSALLLGAQVASADEYGVPGIASFSAGVSNLQAGAHDDVSTSFFLNTRDDGAGNTRMAGGPAKNVTVQLPPGLVGNPTTVATCTPAELSKYHCPTASQVGVMDVYVNFQGIVGLLVANNGIFNMVPNRGEVAAFGTNIAQTTTARIVASVRTDGDYGLTMTVPNSFDELPLYGTNLTIWGVPADPSHDALRFSPTDGNSVPGHEAGVPRRPFISNPAECGVPRSATLTYNTWNHPELFASATSDPQTLTGCDKLRFDPAFTTTSDTRQAGAPFGLGADLTVPQTDGNPDGLATPPLKKATVALPEGVTISPSSADGLVGCTDAELGLHTNDPVTCPDASRIGDVSLQTPLLDETLTGGIYVGTQQSDDPNSGRMFRIFLELQSQERGLLIKLPGELGVDPATGRVTATFDNNPALPFNHLRLQFKGGARAPLRTPKACGIYTTRAFLTPYSAPDAAPVESDSSFTVDQNCDLAGKFEPTLDAGVTNPTAGGSSAFVLNVGRPNGQQDITSMKITLPPGLLAHVGSVPLCADAQAASGTCSAASQVGQTTIAAGAGTSPLHVPQPGKAPTAVYLAGPYKGAPFSLSIVVPAQAGPFDLGTVVVRAALFVDPVDAHVTVVSDPIPTILKGIPLDIQKINVTMNRSGFMVNPTSCAPMQITATLTSVGGIDVPVASRFQVGDCQALPLTPKLAIALSGRRQTTEGKHPA
ncbi:MAG: hypothetical protein QOK11_82, partial [Pseudonocardiales bacterium]|nr:hypothetical protein [Pseudonocardiales bacterium]